jgi:hypothetical protein
VSLLLGQLSLWYQARPLEVGEEAVITVKLSGDGETSQPTVRLQPTTALEVTVGPVRVFSEREVSWNIKARENGLHRLVFRVGDWAAAKELAVGHGFMRVSTRRPGWRWSEALLYPGEEPFGPDSPVQSITIAYPRRPSWASGSDSWVVYWFVVSLLAALCFRPWMNVHI